MERWRAKERRNSKLNSHSFFPIRGADGSAILLHEALPHKPFLTSNSHKPFLHEGYYRHRQNLAKMSTFMMACIKVTGPGMADYMAAFPTPLEPFGGKLLTKVKLAEVPCAERTTAEDFDTALIFSFPDADKAIAFKDSEAFNSNGSLGPLCIIPSLGNEMELYHRTDDDAPPPPRTNDEMVPVQDNTDYHAEQQVYNKPDYSAE